MRLVTQAIACCPLLANVDKEEKRDVKLRYPITPDGRYFVVRGRLWRCSDPSLSPDRRAELTRELMNARRDKGRAMNTSDPVAREEARHRVDAAKNALGERGAVWWHDGAPDWNRHMVRNSPYSEWFRALQ